MTQTARIPALCPDMGARNEALRQIIQRAKIDTSYCYDTERLLDERIGEMARTCATVLDFGKSSRDRFGLFSTGQIETADINRFEGYPDYLCDICDRDTLPGRTYDGIICNAILEHVYDPFSAVANMQALLKDGEICLCYVPYLYRYHAPEDLMYQDYYRYSRDGIAWLFRDFSDLTLYSVRGRTSAALNNTFKFWKRSVETRFPGANRLVDRIFGGAYDPLQTSGYVIRAIK